MPILNTKSCFSPLGCVRPRVCLPRGFLENNRIALGVSLFTTLVLALTVCLGVLQIKLNIFKVPLY